MSGAIPCPGKIESHIGTSKVSGAIIKCSKCCITKTTLRDIRRICPDIEGSLRCTIYKNRIANRTTFRIPIYRCQRSTPCKGFIFHRSHAVRNRNTRQSCLRKGPLANFLQTRRKRHIFQLITVGKSRCIYHQYRGTELQRLQGTASIKCPSGDCLHRIWYCDRRKIRVLVEGTQTNLF